MARTSTRHRRAVALVVAGAIAALAAAAGSSASTRYRVRPGDTLSGIAARMHTTVAALMRLNHLRSPDLIMVGQWLRVPVPAPVWMRYRVVPGDTLTWIAQRFGTTISVLEKANGIDRGATLQAGRVIRVPARAAGPPQRSTQSAGTVIGTIRQWAAYYGVPGDLAVGLAWMESGFNPEMVSPVGAWGVMQLMPDTWEYAQDVLVQERLPRTAEGNIRAGCAFLGHLLRAFGDTRLALAAYYQGERSVRTQGVLAVSEAYVADVLALTARAARL